MIKLRITNYELRITTGEYMKRNLHDYIQEIDKKLSVNESKTNWRQLLSNHLIETGFYQHERLIHLIVTVTFAILTIIVFLFMLNNYSIGIFILFILLLLLLIPYIFHYYHLENNVQKMYIQYDKLKQKID